MYNSAKKKKIQPTNDIPCLYRVQLFRCVVSIQLQQIEWVMVCHVVLIQYQLTYKLLALKTIIRAITTILNSLCGCE